MGSLSISAGADGRASHPGTNPAIAGEDHPRAKAKLWHLVAYGGDRNEPQA